MTIYTHSLIECYSSMSRLAYKKAIKDAIEIVDKGVHGIPINQQSESVFLATLENIDNILPTITDKKTYITDIYKRVIASYKTANINKLILDKIAYIHCLHNIDNAIMREAKDLTDLNIKADKLEIVFYIDHSASMGLAAVYPMMNSVIESLKQKEAMGASIKIYLFGDSRHELGRHLTLAEYSTGLANHTYTFNGGCTEFNPAWDLSTHNPLSCIAIILSDGEFNGRFNLSQLKFHAGIQAVIFYAPPWSPLQVTKKHAAAISAHINQSAVYNGDIPPGQIQRLSTVLDELAVNSLIPELPGRTRIGTVSLPTKLLLPSGLMGVLNKCSSGTFVTNLCNMYEQLYASAKQDIERCFFSDLFLEIMSLNSCIVKFCEAQLGGEKHSDMNKYWAMLLKTVTNVRELISQEYPKLLAKYQYDKNKLAIIEATFQKATTVSEREDILEKKGTPSAYVVFPKCTNIDALAAMYHRMRTMHAGPENVELDHLLVGMFSRAQIEKNIHEDNQDFAVPIYRLGSGNVDMFSIVRLLPGYLREQQKLHNKLVSADFTFQPRVTKRIMCFLEAARRQGAKFPDWITDALTEQVKLDSSLTSDKEDENITVFWMHILKQLKDKGLTDQELATINKRLEVMAIKWFVTKNIDDAQVKYRKLLYPGVNSFIETDNAKAYVTFVDKTNNLLDADTGAPYQKAVEITNPIDIAGAFWQNYRWNGGYIRPTYMTNGAVTLWNTKGPTPAQVLTSQLKQLGYSDMQINAHMHTLSNANMIKSVLFDSNPTETMKLIKETCKNAPLLAEVITVNIYKNQILDALLERLDKYHAKIIQGIYDFPKVDHNKYPNETDYLLECELKEIKPISFPDTYKDQAKQLVDTYYDKFTEYINKQLNTCIQLVGYTTYLESEKKKPQDNNNNKLFECPILLDKMLNPAVTNCGHSFEYSAIEKVKSENKPCPLCNAGITSISINYTLKNMLNELKSIENI
jgi:hypothetical protein